MPHGWRVCSRRLKPAAPCNRRLPGQIYRRAEQLFDVRHNVARMKGWFADVLSAPAAGPKAPGAGLRTSVRRVGLDPPVRKRDHADSQKVGLDPPYPDTERSIDPQ